MPGQVAFALVALLAQSALALPDAFTGTLEGEASTYIAEVESISASALSSIHKAYAITGFGKQGGQPRVYIVAWDSDIDDLRRRPELKRPRAATASDKPIKVDRTEEGGVGIVLDLGRHAKGEGASSYCERAARKIDQELGKSPDAPSATCTRRNTVTLPRKITAEDAHTLGDLRFVWAVYSFTVHTLNQEGVRVAQSATTKNTPLWDDGFTGDGEVIAVSDTGLDREQCAFSESNKVKDYTSYGPEEFAGDDFNGHGTHTAGTALGKEKDFSGMAKDAQLVVSDIEAGENGQLAVPSDFIDLLETEQSNGARISSASWGTDDTYTEVAKSVDEFMRDNKEFLFVVAAGNAGSDKSTITSPGDAKNALTVGATVKPSLCDDLGCKDDEQAVPCCFACPSSECPNDSVPVASFSSRGPTSDGRRKPDLVATGVYVGSSVPSPCNFKAASGTSMATPLVAGSAAVIRQWLRDSEGLSSPTNNLLRAVLAASTQTLTSQTEDAEGLGMLILKDVRNGKELIVNEDSVTDTQSNPNKHSFTTSQEKDVVATLAWNDEESSAGDPKLINKLDLELDCDGDTVSDDSEDSTLKKVTLENVADNVACEVKVTADRNQFFDPIPGGQPYAVFVSTARTGDLQFNPSDVSKTKDLSRARFSEASRAALKVRWLLLLWYIALFSESCD